MIPSGKHTNSYWKWPFSSWIYPLKMVDLSIVFCMFTRPGKMMKFNIPTCDLRMVHVPKPKPCPRRSTRLHRLWLYGFWSHGFDHHFHVRICCCYTIIISLYIYQVDHHFGVKKKAPFLDKAAMPLSATSSIGEKSPVSMVKSKKKTAGGHWHIHQLSPVAHGQQNDPHREEPQTVKGCAEHPASVFMPPTLTWLALLMVW